MDRPACSIGRWAALCLLLAGAPAFAAVPVDRVKVDLEPLIRASAKSPIQFAVPVRHAVTAATGGVWSLADGRATWHYTVQIPTAVSLSFHASRVSLPDSATLIVRGHSATAVYKKANIHKGELWSRIAVGDVLDFTLDVAAADRARVVLEIASLQAGYRGLGGAVKNHPYFSRMQAQAAAAGNESCVQNYECKVTSANTPAGQATVALIIGNLYQCTGVLINNVAADNTPYVLTARHCETGQLGGGEPGAAYGISVYWNAISPCGQPLGTLYDAGIPNQTGAVTLVEQQDIWLIRLDSAPVVPDAQFAGFDATGATVQGGYSIHHAIGFNKQFTSWFGRPALIHEAGVLGVTYVSDFLETINQVGNIGPGASGGGLFDQRDKLVGTLSLGRISNDSSEYGACPVATPPAPNGSNGEADFTSFAAVWNSTADTTSSTALTTLKTVLDPANTGTRVVPSAPAATMSFTASANSAAVGSSVQMSWDAPGATQCTATGGMAADGWGGTKGGSGIQQVSETIESAVLYTLTCQLPGGRSIKSSVSVIWGSPNPRLAFTDPGVVWTTTPALITWDSNFAPCSITGGSLALANLPPVGSVTTTQDTPGDVTYQIACGPPELNLGATAHISYVTPSIVLTANGTDRLLGEQFFLQWQSYATTCTLSGGAPNDGWAAQGPDTNGAFSPDVTALGTYTYTVTCSSGAISISKSIIVTFENNAPYVDVSIDRTSAAFALNPPNYFTLSWNSNLSQCQPSSDPAIGGFISNLLPQDTGTVAPPAPGTYAFTVTCYKFNTAADSVSSAPIVVTVLPPEPPTASVSIEPASVVTGQFFTVTWSSTNALDCAGTGGTAEGIWNPQITAGSQDWFSSTPGKFTFAISCRSISSTVPNAEAEATVTVTDAVPPSATLTTNLTRITQGQAFTLTWSSAHATACTASGGGASGTPWSGTLATSGSITETSNTAGNFTYTVECGNGVQMAQANTTVTVSAPAQSGGSSGGGGGGGSTDSWTLAALAALLTLRRRGRFRRN